MGRVISGLEIFLREPPAWALEARWGLLSHAPSVGPDLAGARELVARRFPGRLTTLFSPQHGLLGEKQDNMIASGDFADPVLHLPVVSLYGPRLTPPPEALDAGGRDPGGPGGRGHPGLHLCRHPGQGHGCGGAPP